MDLTILKNIGLTDGEIRIYEVLLEGGEQPASIVIEKSGLKKGDCYNKLYDLVRVGFVEELSLNKKKNFRLAHPETIENYVHDRLNSIADTEREVNALLPAIMSTYNLSYHKPGVRYFEGEEGLKKVMDDTLQTNTEILSFIDIETFEKFHINLNKKYLKKRYLAKINKKNLLPKTDYILEYAKKNTTEFTEFHVIEPNPSLKGISMNIYGNKVSFQTFKKNSLISIIIDDPMIANFLRVLYQLLWSQAQPV